MITKRWLPIIALLLIGLLASGATASPMDYVYYVGYESWGSINPNLPAIDLVARDQPSLGVDFLPKAMFWSTFYVQTGQNVSFTFTRYSGDTVSGYVSVVPGGFVGETVTKTISIGGVTNTTTAYSIPLLPHAFTFIGAKHIPTNRMGYVVFEHETDINFMGYTIYSSHIDAFTEKANIKTDLVQRAAIIANTGSASVHFYQSLPENYGAVAGPSSTADYLRQGVEWVTELTTFLFNPDPENPGLVVMTWFLFTEALYYFRFFSIENILLVVVLGEMGGLAYTASKSKDIFDFFKNAWKLQMDIFNFLTWFIEFVTRTFEALAGVLGTMVGIGKDLVTGTFDILKGLLKYIGF
jgi:hypothetical protein